MHVLKDVITCFILCYKAFNRMLHSVQLCVTARFICVLQSVELYVTAYLIVF